MKKVLALILLTVLVLSLAACGNKPENKPTDPNQGAAEGSVLDAALWSLRYDESVWTYEEDAFTDDEEYSGITLTIPDGEESYIVNAEISAVIDTPEDFRGYLDSYGFDAYEYAENNAYELTAIGGVDCLKQEGNYWGEPCLRYFGRVENANTTVFIEIIGEYEDQRVNDLLSGLSFKITDIGNVDCPWPWNGEAFSAEDATVSVGSKKINSQWLAFEESFVTAETFDHQVAVVGNNVYILGDDALKQYSMSNNKLTYVKDIELDGDYEYITSAKDGSLWVSGMSEDLLNVKDGAVVKTFEDTDNVAMNYGGTWGINWFSSSECEKITVSGDTLTREAITFPEVDIISELFVDDDYIYVCGNAVDESGHKVFVYDTAGTLKLTLADEEGESLGSITYVTKTSDGFIGLDGNMREVVLWNKDGTFAGTAEDGDLFSTNYPWFCDGTLTSDNSLFVIMTDERADESAMELVAFKLSGF